VRLVLKGALFIQYGRTSTRFTYKSPRCFTRCDLLMGFMAGENRSGEVLVDVMRHRCLIALKHPAYRARCRCGFERSAVRHRKWRLLLATRIRYEVC